MKTLKVYMSDAEAVEVAAMARAVGLPVSCFLKRSALRQTIEAAAVVPEANLRLYSDFGRVAANLNQLAKSLNSGRVPSDFGPKLVFVLTSLKSSVDATRRQLIGADSDR